jgi:hypothetical protein
VLRFHSMASVVAWLNSIEMGDRRLARYRAWLQWRVAFGASTPWERIIEAAAAGNGSFEHFSSAGELLGSLLTEHPPKGVDSVILLRQSQFWPRGGQWPGVTDENHAPSMVAPCPAEVRSAPSSSHRVRGHSNPQHTRTHVLTEIIDLRTQRGNKRSKHGPAWRSTREIPTALYRHISSDPSGHKACEPGKAGKLCTSCSRSLTRGLCECATVPIPIDADGPDFDWTTWLELSAKQRGGAMARKNKGVRRRPLTALTTPNFNPHAVRACCVNTLMAREGGLEAGNTTAV